MKMDKLNKKLTKLYWVEKISLADILIFLVQSWFEGIRVNYDRYQRSPLAAKFLTYLDMAGLNRIFFPVELRLGRKDAEGNALNYRVEKELNDCIEGFFARHIPQESRRFKDTLKSYIAAVLQGKVIFITMVASEINFKTASAGENNIICLNDHPLNYLLRGFYKDRGFVIRRPVISMRYIIFYLRPFCYLAYFLLCKLGNYKPKSNISDINPAIWVEYYPDHFHAFWIGKIRAQGFDIVNYLDRVDTPVVKETIDEIETKGLKWIDAHLPSLIGMSRLSLLDFLKIFRNLFSVYFSRPVWFGVFKFEYFFLLPIYESVFLRYKVKILVQHQECLWKQGVQALAVERAGGIMVGYHWSAYPYYLMSAENFPQHVYFAWGKMMGELLGKKDVTHRYILPSGICPAFNGQKPERNNIFSKNVDFVISVFDSCVRYDLFQSPDSLSEFYLKILNIVEKHPGFGCIIKSKSPLHQTLLSLPSGRAIAERVEKLKDRNRLAIFDFNEYPLAAAAHSDLSVGYGINSACAVAVTMEGRAAINWDCCGFRKHPFYKYSDQKIVFRTLDELEEAILKASKGDKTIGDYSRWKKHINYFEDSSSVNRIVDFLESYMKESMSTGNPEHSLDFAVKKYLADNKVSGNFYEREDFWEDDQYIA